MSSYRQVLQPRIRVRVTIGSMQSSTTSPFYKGYRFGAEIISYTVWFYFRFSLSYGDVQELLASLGDRRDV